MALRDQPYLPLYVQDFMTDEKLMECSASTTGVYIRLMCVLHKSEQYGTILLKQKFKQTDKQTNNFALQIAKFLPYDFDCIHIAICELIDEKVLIIEGDNLIQKRMVKDAMISEKRALAGKKGGEETQRDKPKIKPKFAKAKNKAKPENEIVIEDEVIIDIELFKELEPKNKVTEAFEKYLEMRKEKKKIPTEYAIDLIKKEVWKLAGKDESLAIAILNQSTKNNWIDVYPLKENNNLNKKGNVHQTAIPPSKTGFGSL